MSYEMARRSLWRTGSEEDYAVSPTGLAGFVLTNGSMSSNTSGEGEIRKNIIEADSVDCMVALPVQLFYSGQFGGFRSIGVQTLC